MHTARSRSRRACARRITSYNVCYTKLLRETRIAIVQRRGELDGFELPRNVALFLAEHFRNNVRELEGALKRRITSYNVCYTKLLR